jgi:hypothetical protein
LALRVASAAARFEAVVVLPSSAVALVTAMTIVSPSTAVCARFAASSAYMSPNRSR